MDEELLSPLDFFVTLRASNMPELCDARIQYEPMIACRVAEHLSHAQLAQLRDLVAEPANTELFHATDGEFHKTILGVSGNAFRSRIGKLLQVRGDQGRQAFQRRDSLSGAISAGSSGDHGGAGRTGCGGGMMDDAAAYGACQECAEGGGG